MAIENSAKLWSRRKKYYQTKLFGLDPSKSKTKETVQPEPNPIENEEERESNLEKNKGKNSHLCKKICLFGIGGVVGVVGILMCIFWPFLTNLLLQKTLALTPGSAVFDGWVETPIPIYFKMYMFNWTNPKTSLRGPEKPAFQQLGPYVFLKHQIKRNITWNDNDTITYLIEDQYLHFIPELSTGSLNDSVTNINAIPMIIGWYCRDFTWIEKSIVNSFLLASGSSLVKTDTVGNMLFDGSRDPILSILNVFKPFIKNLPLKEKFGWLYSQNFTTASDGVYTMHTGRNDISTVGLASAWNYSNRTMLSGDCGRVYGSFGELYPPHTYDLDNVDMFGYTTCSSGPVHRNGTTSIGGIPVALYVGGADSWSNARDCFCPEEDSCPLSGAHDVSQCMGVPIYLSWPHFYLADPVYRDSVVGLNPDPDIHQLRFYMADITGATVKARFKMQINFPMQTISGMSMFKDVQNVVMPIFWTSQEADLPPSKLNAMFWMVHGVREGRWISLILGSFGLLLVVIGIVLAYRGHFRR